jgi:hypothetical protein
MSTDERLERLGLLHLADDPEALALHAKQKSAELVERARKWREQQTPNYEKWIAESSRNAAQRSTAPQSFLSVGQPPGQPAEVPATFHVAASAWELVNEVGWWTADLDDALVQEINSLCAALTELLGDAGKSAKPAPTELRAVSDAARLVRAKIGKRQLRPSSSLAMLLALSDGITRGALSR